MKVRKVLLLVVLSVALSGCGRSTFWMEEYTPVTSEEKAAVAIMTERIMVATPHTLAGHDQYWDDAIAAANLAAKRSCCAERIYEYEGPFGGPFHKTGRFREMNSVATK